MPNRAPNGRVFTVALNPAIDVSSDARHIQPTRKIRTRNEKHHPGGGGVNVARVVAELGGRPELLYLSGGATGKLFESQIHRYPIHCHRIQIQGDTRVSFTVHELDSGLEYRCVPEGPLITKSEVEQAVQLLERWNLSSGDYLVASGSMPRGVSDDLYGRIAEIAKSREAYFILDTSGSALQAALAKKSVFLIKPSLGELERLVGQELDGNKARDAAMDLVLDGSAQYVAVSMGARGAFLASKEGINFAPAVEVVLRSAVGAGDSFVGGMVYSLASGKNINDAFRLGVCAGAAAVMTQGTELCRRDDVFGLYAATRAEN